MTDTNQPAEDPQDCAPLHRPTALCAAPRFPMYGLALRCVVLVPALMHVMFYVLHCMQDEWLRRFPLVDRFLRVLEQVPEQSGPRTRKIVYKTVHLKLEGVVRAFPVQGWL